MNKEIKKANDIICFIKDTLGFKSISKFAVACGFSKQYVCKVFKCEKAISNSLFISIRTLVFDYSLFNGGFDIYNLLLNKLVEFSLLNLKNFNDSLISLLVKEYKLNFFTTFTFYY